MVAVGLLSNELGIWRTQEGDHLSEMAGCIVRAILEVDALEEVTAACQGPDLPTVSLELTRMLP